MDRDVIPADRFTGIGALIFLLKLADTARHCCWHSRVKNKNIEYLYVIKKEEEKNILGGSGI